MKLKYSLIKNRTLLSNGFNNLITRVWHKMRFRI